MLGWWIEVLLGWVEAEGSDPDVPAATVVGFEEEEAVADEEGTLGVRDEEESLDRFRSRVEEDCSEWRLFRSQGRVVDWKRNGKKLARGERKETKTDAVVELTR